MGGCGGGEFGGIGVRTVGLADVLLDVILDLLLYLVELLHLLLVVGVELGVRALPFEGVADHFFCLGLVEWREVEFLKGGDGEALVVAVVGEDVLFFDDILVVDEVVVGVVVVDVGIAPLAPLAHRARPLHEALPQDLPLQARRNAVVLALLTALAARRRRAAQALQEMQMGGLPRSEVPEVVDAVHSLVVDPGWERAYLAKAGSLIA